jgi:hypothetical protein
MQLRKISQLYSLHARTLSADIAARMTIGSGIQGRTRASRSGVTSIIGGAGSRIRVA